MVAGSLRRVESTGDGDGRTVRFIPRESGLVELSAAFGLAVLDGLTLDARHGPNGPWAVRCIAPNQDLRSLGAIGRGNLIFEACRAALRTDVARLSVRLSL